MSSQEEQSMMLRDKESRREEQNDKRIIYSNFLTNSGRKEMSQEGRILLQLIIIIRNKSHVQKKNKILDESSRNDEKKMSLEEKLQVFFVVFCLIWFCIGLYPTKVTSRFLEPFVKTKGGDWHFHLSWWARITAELKGRNGHFSAQFTYSHWKSFLWWDK